MKLKFVTILLFCMTIYLPVFAQTTPQSGLFTGDKKLACEAVLCLSSSADRPHECKPPIDKFFSLYSWRPDKALDFLHLCPEAGDVDLLVDGMKSCNPNGLNTYNTYNIGGNESVQMVISSELPMLCKRFFASPFGSGSNSKPLYVGTPENGGSWVDPKDYALALRNYNQMMANKAQSTQFNGGY